MIQNLIPLDRARLILQDLEPLIVEAHYDALEATNEQSRHAIGIPNKSARAFNMNSNVINSFKNKIVPYMDYIEIVPKNNTFVFLIKDTIAAKFKKHKKKGGSSNIKTREIGYFHAQQLQILFPGIPLIGYLEFAYRANEEHTEFEFIKIVCTYNKMEVWSLDLTIGKEDGLEGQIGIVPITPTPTPPSTRRVTINSQKDKAIND